MNHLISNRESGGPLKAWSGHSEILSHGDLQEMANAMKSLVLQIYILQSINCRELYKFYSIPLAKL